MQKWIYRILGEEFGPVTTDELRALVNDGILSPDDQTRQEESASWVRIDEALGCGPDAAVADLEIATSVDDLLSGSADSDQFVDPQSGGLMDDSRFSVADTDEFADGNHPHYFADTLGQTLGPLSLNDLSHMILTGVVTATDVVRHSQDGAGIPAHSHPRLRALFHDVTLQTLDPAAHPTQTPAQAAKSVQAAGSAPPVSSAPAASEAAPAPAGGSEKLSGEAAATHVSPNAASAASPKRPDVPAKTRNKPRGRHEAAAAAQQDPAVEDQLLESIVADVLLAPDPPKTTTARAASSSDHNGSSPSSSADTSSSTGDPARASSVSSEAALVVKETAAASSNAVPAGAAPAPAVRPPVSKSRSASAKKKGSDGHAGRKWLLAGLSLGIVAVAGAWFSGLLAAGAPPVDTLQPLTQFKTEYEAVKAEQLSPQQWQALQTRFRPEAETIVRHLDSRDTYLEEKEKWHRFAAMKLLQLLECPLENTRLRAQCFTEFSGMVARGI